MPTPPDFSGAIISDAKLGEYLFDPKHLEGWPKGKFLMQAGFEPEDPEGLRAALMAQASSSETMTTETEFGMKFECDGVMFGPKGSRIMVRTVWQVDHGAEAPRFVTFKPLRKEQ